MKELKGVIGPKNNPPVGIQERVLGMIQVRRSHLNISLSNLFVFFLLLLQTWALAFRQDPDLKNVEHFYQECKQQGLEFPPPESENLIQTAVPATVSSIIAIQ